ncbi:MAG: DUF4340 domain-containing protein [Saprospiraceae bacterium]|nr:DUF4340 domain-containing protein [Saprospiraceae bacterium]
MKKNYWLIAIFLLLGGATAWYFWGGKQSSNSTLGWDRLFKVEEQDIQKIFIAKRTGETTTIERDGGGWKVNGQKASKNAVENLLEAVTKLELQSVPPPAATDNVVKELASRGIKVEVYGNRDKKLKAYYIGGVTADARGTYAIMDGSEQPMVLQIPQMEGQIRSRFDLTGDDWRDRNVFSYKPEDIEAVSVEYPQQRNKSFKLKRSGQSWEVKPFYDNVPAINRPVSKGRVEGFLVGFGGLMAEGFENQYAEKDSIRMMIPFTVVSVTDVKGQERKAAFYPTYRKDKDTGERRSEVVERYFADVSTGDWMLTQHRVFEKIFWPYESFFEEPGKAVKD